VATLYEYYNTGDDAYFGIKGKLASFNNAHAKVAQAQQFVGLEITL
jgi:hypothetical protein